MGDPIKAFVIMDPLTGETLPEVGRGYTFTEPEAGLPRLFETEGGAKQALRWWNKGPVYAEVDHFDDYSTKVGPSDPGGPNPERVARGLVVRPVTLVFD